VKSKFYFQGKSSLAGLAVKQRESGSSLRGRAQLDRHGRRELRRVLYMCALVAMRWDPSMRHWAERLKARGKPTKVVIVAVGTASIDGG
jgi:transposase